jgi:hypothetical protein
MFDMLSTWVIIWLQNINACVRVIEAQNLFSRKILPTKSRLIWGFYIEKIKNVLPTSQIFKVTIIETKVVVPFQPHNF